MHNNSDKTYKILETNRRWHVTLPVVLAQGLGLKPGDKIKWEIYQGNLTIKKE